MESDLDQHKAAHIVAAKAALRAAQRGQTWEQRVRAIARMNAASRLAKAGMMKSTKGETVEEAIANLTEATALYLSEFPLPDGLFQPTTNLPCMAICRKT